MNNEFLERYELNGRGFHGYRFRDCYGGDCSIQDSSNAGEPRIWLGQGDNRMLLNQEMVKQLLPLLQHFADTGDYF